MELLSVNGVTSVDRILLPIVIYADIFLITAYLNAEYY